MKFSQFFALSILLSIGSLNAYDFAQSPSWFSIDGEESNARYGTKEEAQANTAIKFAPEEKIETKDKYARETYSPKLTMQTQPQKQMRMTMKSAPKKVSMANRTSKRNRK